MKFQIMIIIIIIMMEKIKGMKYFDTASLAMNPPMYMMDGSLDVGDFDQDGGLDVVGGGLSMNEENTFVLYRQNVSLHFYNVANVVNFPDGVPSGFSNGRIVFIDINHDGLLDIFFAG